MFIPINREEIQLPTDHNNGVSSTDESIFLRTMMKRHGWMVTMVLPNVCWV